jgi:hypothetical protein
VNLQTKINRIIKFFDYAKKSASADIQLVIRYTTIQNKLYSVLKSKLSILAKIEINLSYYFIMVINFFITKHNLN